MLRRAHRRYSSILPLPPRRCQCCVRPRHETSWEVTEIKRRGRCGPARQSLAAVTNSKLRGMLHRHPSQSAYGASKLHLAKRWTSNGHIEFGLPPAGGFARLRPNEHPAPCWYLWRMVKPNILHFELTLTVGLGHLYPRQQACFSLGETVEALVRWCFWELRHDTDELTRIDRGNAHLSGHSPMH